jgi:hypothetical protein
MEDQAYKPTMIHKTYKHYVTFVCDTQTMHGPKFELVVMEGVSKTYRMKNNEPRFMRNSKGTTLLGEQMWHRGVYCVDKIQKSNHV